MDEPARKCGVLITGPLGNSQEQPFKDGNDVLPWWLPWLRIRLPMQGTQVRSLVWEDPTCCGAAKPVSHNY